MFKILTLALFLCTASTIMTAQTATNTLTLDITACIDGDSQLVIQGNTIQWKNLDYRVPGNTFDCSSAATSISTTLNGSPVMTAYSWTPTWPAQGDAVSSSVFTGLLPALPLAPLSVTLEAVAARNSIFIAQLPTISNGGMLVLDFNDSPPPGSAVYEARLKITYPALPPSIARNGVVPIYGSLTTIQPGSWVSIYGSNLASATTVWNGDFPTSLGNTSVTINGKPAYLWFVSPTQINLQAPTDSATGSALVVVTTAAGTDSSAVTLASYAPSFSLLSARYPAAIVLTPGSPGNSGGGYDIIGPGGAFSYATRPVKAGETLILYGVGFGPTTPAVPAGAAFSGAAPSVTLPVITIGGVQANVTFGGIVQAGLFQFNVVVPNAGSGDQPLAALIGGVTTPSNIFVTLQ